MRIIFGCIEARFDINISIVGMACSALPTSSQIKNNRSFTAFAWLFPLLY